MGDNDHSLSPIVMPAFGSRQWRDCPAGPCGGEFAERPRLRDLGGTPLKISPQIAPLPTRDHITTRWIRSIPHFDKNRSLDKTLPPLQTILPTVY